MSSDFSIRIGGDSTAATAAIQRTQGALTGLSDQAASFGTKLRHVGETIQAWGNSLRMVADLGKRAFGSLVGDAFAAANRIGMVAKQTGIATEALQRLGHAAAMNDSISFEEMSQGLKFLSRNMGNAAAGGKEAQAAFARIGLSVADLSKMSPDQVFLKLSDAIKSGAIPESQRMSVVMQLLGRGASGLIPLLTEGGDAIRAMGSKAKVMS